VVISATIRTNSLKRFDGVHRTPVAKQTTTFVHAPNSRRSCAVRPKEAGHLSYGSFCSPRDQPAIPRKNGHRLAMRRTVVSDSAVDQREDVVSGFSRTDAVWLKANATDGPVAGFCRR
jgi:hypothetical protein